MTQHVTMDAVAADAWQTAILMPDKVKFRWVPLLKPFKAGQTTVGLSDAGEWIAVGSGEARRLLTWSSAMLAVLSYPKHRASMDLAIASAHAGLDPRRVGEAFPWENIISTGLESSDEAWIDRAVEWVDRSVRNENVLAILVELARGERVVSNFLRSSAKDRVDSIAEDVVREAVHVLALLDIGQVEQQHLTGGARGYTERDLVVYPYHGPKAHEVHVVEVLNMLPSGSVAHVSRVLDGKVSKVKRANNFIVHTGVLVAVGLHEEQRRQLEHGKEFALLSAKPTGEAVAKAICAWLFTPPVR